MANIIIDVSTVEGRKSISIDSVLFDLFSQLFDSDSDARSDIRNIIRFWSKNKNLSRKVRHYVLFRVSRKDLVREVIELSEFQTLFRPDVRH